MNCYHNCEPQNCLNYLICGESLPLKDLSDVGICTNCECTFGSFTSGKGILKINDEPQNACCSCLDKVSLVTQPHCEHYALCIMHYALSASKAVTTMMKVQNLNFRMMMKIYKRFIFVVSLHYFQNMNQS
jgi:hypothetical protein